MIEEQLSMASVGWFPELLGGGLGFVCKFEVGVELAEALVVSGDVLLED